MGFATKGGKLGGKSNVSNSVAYIVSYVPLSYSIPNIISARRVLRYLLISESKLLISVARRSSASVGEGLKDFLSEYARI